MEKRVTKTDMVREHLEKNGSITSWEAIQNYKATRLSAIIFNLKNIHGMDIESEMIEDSINGTRYCKYVLGGAR